MLPAGLLPNRERLSAVMAVILLAYVAVRFVQVPPLVLNWEFIGVLLPIRLGVNTLLAVLVAGLTAAGADWLLRDHPALGQRTTYSHWLLPAMTAWVLALVLSNLPFTATWWLAFLVCALLLLAILLAEYSSVSEEGRLYAAVSTALSMLSLILFLMLAISVRGLGLRLFLALPAVGLAAFLAGTRLNLLRSVENWHSLQLLGMTFVIVQLAAVLHYLPVSPLGYGLLLLGALFGLNNFMANLNAEQDWRTAAREPAVALGVFLILAVLV
ncbi:MAG: hypothetical protein KIT08_00375 [Anaerolineales bacterium]|nr:MAG: hypothetical protein KIT08_00375 [Anaerolineales bacterium]